MSTYTPSLGLELITPGSQAGLWGNTTNNSLNLIDQAITGVTPVSFASASGSTYTLTDYNGAEDESRAAVLNITGTATGANTIVIPNKQKTYLVRNNTGQDVTFQTATPSATYVVGAGYSILIFCDGNNNVFTGIAAPSVGTLLVNAGGTGQTTFGSGGFVKSPGGTGTLTASSTVALGSEVTGTLPVANGGTGKATLTSGALLFGNGTGAVGEFVGGSAGQVATWNGSGWTASAPSAGVTSVFGRTGAVTAAAGDYSSYYPSLGGSGASGTWNISILGNAATATSLSGTVAIANGGTGATNATNARTNLGLGTMATANTTDYVNVSGTQTITGAKTFAGINASAIQVPAYNFNPSSSWYISGTTIVGATNYSTVIQCASGGTYNPTGVYGTISDASQKENIEPARNYLDDINKVNIVKYSLKEENSPVPTKLGVIAQEVEQIFPGLIYDAEDGIKNVKMSLFIPMLVKSVQELTAKLEAAEARIAALEAK